MSEKFKVGERVKVKTGYTTRTAKIVAYHDAYNSYEVQFDDNHMFTSVLSSEIEWLTDATPAPAASELTAEALVPTSEQELRALMDHPLSETENEMVRLIMQLDAQNARLASKLEFLKRSSDDLLEAERENTRQHRDNFMMLYKAVSRKAPEVWSEVKPNLIDTSHELDKLSSAVTRYQQEKMLHEKTQEQNAQLAERVKALEAALKERNRALDMLLEGVGFEPTEKKVYVNSASTNRILIGDERDYPILYAVANQRASERLQENS